MAISDIKDWDQASPSGGDLPIASDILLHALPHPVLVLGKDDRIVQANIAAEVFFGMSETVLKRRKADALVGFASPLLALIRQVRLTNATVNEYAVDLGLSPLHTKLEVLGRPIDLNYTQLLLERNDLDLDTVILLDRVQKKLPIVDRAAARLRKEGLIEGRKPNFHVSAAIAAATATQVTYTKAKGADKAQLKQAILSHLRRAETAKRPALIEVVKPMLPSGLTDEQKASKVKNLLVEMRSKDESIRSEGRGAGAFWRIAE